MSEIVFSKEKQRALVFHIVSNPKLWSLVKPHMESTWFTEEILSAKLFESLKKFQETHHGHPVSGKELAESHFIPLEDQKPLLQHIGVCRESAKDFNIEVLKSELSAWLKAVTIRQATLKLRQKFNEGLMDEAETLMVEMSQKLQNCSFEDYGISKFSDFRQDFERERLGREKAVYTGIPLLDDALVKGSKSGGFLAGDQTVVMSTSNAGKTKFASTVIAYNTLKNNTALFITHEGRPTDIKSNLFSCITGKPKAELLAILDSDEETESLAKIAQDIDEKLVYIPYNRAEGMYIEDVINIIRRANEDQVRKTGKPFDLIVDDYPQKLMSKAMMRGKDSQKRFSDRACYEAFNQLALELNTHCLTLAQSNREGSKLSKASKNPPLLTRDNISEAYAIACDTTNFLTLNRPPSAVEEGFLGIYIDKSRSNTTGVCVLTQTDFSVSRTHWTDFQHPQNSYLSVAYQGTKLYDEDAVALLNQFNGMQLTSKQIKEFLKRRQQDDDSNDPPHSASI